MKKIIAIFLALCMSTGHAQTFKVQNLQTLGSSNLALPPIVAGDCANILSYGGKADGITANDAAFTSAIASQASSKVCIYFPPGKYLFNAQATYTFPASIGSLTIKGAGQDATELTWPNSSGGIKANLIDMYDAVHVRDLTFTTGQRNVSTGLFLNQTNTSLLAPANSAQSDITNVTFRGADGYNINNGDMWGVAIHDVGVSNINFVNMFITGATTTPGVPPSSGAGVTIEGSATVPPVVFNFIGSTINYVQSAINYGNYVQGMSINQCNMTIVQSGVVVAAGLSNTQSELSIVNSQFAVTVAAVFVNSLLLPFNFSNNLVEIFDGGTGIILNPGGLYAITGNTFLGLTTHVSSTGVNVVNSTSFVSAGPGVITGNVFFFLNAGVVLGAGSSGANVQSNVYPVVTTAVSNGGTGNTVGGGSQ